VQELLGDGYGPPGATLGGRDLLMMGDDKQCPPIADEPLFQDGAYTGKRVAAEGGPRPDSLVGLAMSLRHECVAEKEGDVVILRQVWRQDDGDDSMSPEERAAYRAEGDKFVRVVGRLADCVWTRDEHRWLAERNRSRLTSTAEGRAEYAKFVDPLRPAVLLMDGRKKNAKGEDGAEQLNAVELRRLSRCTGVPIASWGATHRKPTGHGCCAGGRRGVPWARREHGVVRGCAGIVDAEPVGGGRLDEWRDGLGARLCVGRGR
jgi:hypothetical protein